MIHGDSDLCSYLLTYGELPHVVVNLFWFYLDVCFLSELLEKCFSILQNPAYRQAAGTVEGYKTLTDILDEGNDWFGNQQRILVATKVVKFLSEAHAVRLRLTRLTIDDILVKRTDFKVSTQKKRFCKLHYCHYQGHDKK